MRLAYIGIFGLLGVFSRYFLGIWILQLLPSHFPYGTFLINIIGAFLIGILYTAGVEYSVIQSDIRIGLWVGFLGGFTTFSSYSLETARLIEDAKYIQAALYITISPALGLLMTFTGMFLTRHFLSR